MTSELTRGVARFLLLPLLVLAVAVLVKGYTSVGDGFSAGVIAALAILLQYLAFGFEEAERRLPVRHATAVALSGLLLALVLAAAPLAAGEPLLTHAPSAGVEPVKIGTLELVTAVLFDLAIFLLVVGMVVAVIRALLAPVEGESA